MTAIASKPVGRLLVDSPADIAAAILVRSHGGVDVLLIGDDVYAAKLHSRLTLLADRGEAIRLGTYTQGVSLQDLIDDLEHVIR
jgi:predicted nicotinamide N-methyase